MRELDETQVTFAPSVCYPVDHSRALDVLRPSALARVTARSEGSQFLHLWNQLLTHAGVRKRIRRRVACCFATRSNGITRRMGRRIRRSGIVGGSGTLSPVLGADGRDVRGERRPVTEPVGRVRRVEAGDRRQRQRRRRAGQPQK